ncbi:hypothetical protein WG68_04435 [Arsukibacterium ikkense]|uniref:Uncharacterized protein n=1 Tax=Arsukibacterium ikkense TaxID=336831 RepID=A0A0M2V808_9GAMM|nr:hypothetical protein [Arsukibacterium ikkense]KKO46559.1 hypothetical protein WG68_04435 [Arsukibacterium ikkense]
MDNIFAQYQIEMPKAYQDKIKNYVATGSQNQSRENAPFDRQIDFWYMALCIAFQKGLTPTKEKDTYNAISAEILSRNPHRITQMQMISLTIAEEPSILLEPKKMLDICTSLANAGIPVLLSILADTESTPLWNIYYELEDLAS